MRIWHEIKILSVGLCKAWDDAQFFNATERQDGPDNVHPLHGDKPDPERHASIDGSRRKRDAVVTDEHDFEPGWNGGGA